MWFKKIAIVSVLFLTLSACSTTAKKTSEDELQKIKTAKINAQLGIAYLEQNNIQRSKQKLMKAIDLAPNIPETWYSMAYFYEATGNPEEAKRHYLKAIAIAPYRGDSQNNYGTFLCRKGEYKASISHFMLAVQDRNYLDPSDAYENAGLCAQKIPDLAGAEDYFEQAIAEDPSRPVSLIKLAEISFKKGELESSEKHLDQFLAVSPPTEQSQRLSKLIFLRRHPAVTAEAAVKPVVHKKKFKKFAGKRKKATVKHAQNKLKKNKKPVLKKALARNGVKKNKTKRLAAVSKAKKAGIARKHRPKRLAAAKAKKHKVIRKKQTPHIARQIKKTVPVKKYQHFNNNLMAEKKKSVTEIQMV